MERRGEKGLSASWPFRNVVLAVHANLGAPPDETAATNGRHDLALGDITRDPFAFALTVSRP